MGILIFGAVSNDFSIAFAEEAKSFSCQRYYKIQEIPDSGTAGVDGDDSGNSLVGISCS